MHGTHISFLKVLYHLSPGGTSGKEPICQCRRCKICGFKPGLRRSPGGGHGNAFQYSCLENPHGQRNLVGYSPWGSKELDMIEQLSTASQFTLPPE